jgi:hypothetical protein
MKTALEMVHLTPGATGWMVRTGEHPSIAATTLAEAAALIPTGSPVHLALPADLPVIERLTLPSTEREELADMVRLQSEKSLPFPIEEVSSDFVMVASRPQESAVLSITVPHAPFETLCQPLRERGIIPERATPYVLHVAAACPAGETVLAVYPEQGQLVVAVVESGALSWMQVLPSTDADRLIAELPQLLLPAIVEGVPTNFSQVLLADECPDLAPALREFFEVAVQPLPPAAPTLTLAINLVPPAWQAHQAQIQKRKRLQQLLLIGAALGLIIIAGALIYLAVLKNRAAKLEAQLAALRPRVEQIQAQRVRAENLGAAIDPQRYSVETLYLLLRNLPSDKIDVTEFDQTLNQWRIVGEAASANIAIDYVSRVKAEKDLGAYTITSEPPRLLPNEHAQFKITGQR